MEITSKDQFEIAEAEFHRLNCNDERKIALAYALDRYVKSVALAEFQSYLESLDLNPALHQWIMTMVSWYWSSMETSEMLRELGIEI